MHTLFKLSTLSIFLCTAIAAFDQLPNELLTKIILIDPEIIGVLSSTCTQINTRCRSWAAEQDKNFLVELREQLIPRCAYFVLKHNTTITECDVAQFIKDDIDDHVSFRAMSAVYPWIKQKELYGAKSCSGSFHYSCVTGPVANGFLIPLCYRRDKAIPMMHYLVEEFLPSALYTSFKVLLQSGLNPDCKFEDKTVFDFIKEIPGYVLAKERLIALCTKYVRCPIDP